MSSIIIGGNECMGRTYRDLCAKYNITARAIPLKKGSFANQLGNPFRIRWSSALRRKQKSTARSLSNCAAAAHPRWNVS